MHIIGHRGASAYTPENTAEAFEKALNMGCFGIELDIRICKSQELVVIHDSTIDRTTNGVGLVKEFTLDELKEFHTLNGESILTLEEAVNFIRITREKSKKHNAKIFIEIKDRSIELQIAQFIKQQIDNKLWAYEDLIALSFRHNELKNIKKFDKNISVGALIGDKNRSDIADIFSNFCPNYILPDIKLLDLNMVKIARNKNTPTIPWTVNKDEDIKKAIEYNVCGVITDDPLKIQEFVSDN